MKTLTIDWETYQAEIEATRNGEALSVIHSLINTINTGITPSFYSHYTGISEGDARVARSYKDLIDLVSNNTKNID